MGNNRKRSAEEVISNLGFKGSLLDVGCGRGEVVRFANEIGFTAKGVDVVKDLLGGDVVYGEAHDLPFEDNSFDVVTSFDAFEHFLPEDTGVILNELNRVAKKAVVLCIALTPSSNGNDVLHINLRSPNEWKKLINEFIDGDISLFLNNHHNATWVITKE